MDLAEAGLTEQPFPNHGNPSAVIPYRSHLDAHDILKDTCENPRGLCLIQGPPLSGKTTTIRAFIASMPEHTAVALVDGNSINADGLLTSMLEQFGFDLEPSSNTVLKGLARVFCLQHAASGNIPLLIVDRVHECEPSALRVLTELAEMRVGSASALRMALVSDRPLAPLLAADGMEPLRTRVCHDFHLRPMSKQEGKLYLHSKLRLAGSDKPDSIFPSEVCDELHEASGGWPGILDRISLLALANAESLPVGVEEIEHPALPAPTGDTTAGDALSSIDDKPAQPPHLIVSNNGSIMQEVTLEQSRLLIGRSDHNDIPIGSRFVSRHHALMVRHGAATFLMDLNSTNGTFVNADRVSNHVLRHQDVITIGHHKIKFYDPFATTRKHVERVDFGDTQIMKTLEDMRNLLARENTEMLPVASEDLPTLQT